MVYLYALMSHNGEQSSSLASVSLQRCFFKHFMNNPTSLLFLALPFHNYSFLRLKTQDDMIFEVLSRINEL
jgi:hypothetical protein